VKKMKFGIFSDTTFSKKKLHDLVYSAMLAVKGDLPDFYVLVAKQGADGVAITNLDRPSVFIIFKNEEQFKRVLIHELTHLKQHKAGYQLEKEARESEKLASFETRLETQGVCLLK